MTPIMRICLSVCLAALAATAALTPARAEVNVYSYRQPFLLEPLFDAFTQETGIPVNVIFAKKGLEERIRQEGANSPVDLLLTSFVWCGLRLGESWELEISIVICHLF